MWDKLSRNKPLAIIAAVTALAFAAWTMALLPTPYAVAASVYDYVYGSVSPPGYFPHQPATPGLIFQAAAANGVDFTAADLDTLSPVPEGLISMDSATFAGMSVHTDVYYFTPTLGLADLFIGTAGSTDLATARDVVLATYEMHSGSVSQPAGIFPANYWTTDPGTDLAWRLGGAPVSPFSSSTFDEYLAYMKAAQMTFDNFLVYVRPGGVYTYVY